MLDRNIKAQQAALGRGTGLSTTDRLILANQLNSLVQQQLTTSDQLTTQPAAARTRQDVEEPELTTHAVATKTTARSRRNSVLAARSSACCSARSRHWSRSPRVGPGAAAASGVLDGKRIAVVVPAHDEEKLIAARSASIPAFVDRMYVVDDRSTDATAERCARRRPARGGDPARAQRGRRRRDRHGVQAGARRPDRRDVRDGGRRPDGPGRPGDARGRGGARRGRLREGEPPVHGRGLEADPALPLPRQRGPVAADEDRLRLLARRRLAVRLHGDLAARSWSCSTSSGSTRATASRTTCSCT